MIKGDWITFEEWFKNVLIVGGGGNIYILRSKNKNKGEKR